MYENVSECTNNNHLIAKFVQIHNKNIATQIVER